MCWMLPALSRLGELKGFSVVRRNLRRSNFHSGTYLIFAYICASNPYKYVSLSDLLFHGLGSLSLHIKHNGRRRETPETVPLRSDRTGKPTTLALRSPLSLASIQALGVEKESIPFK